jgi:hypothetical protein
MIKTLSKGLDWYSTGYISYATVMSGFRHVDGKLDIMSCIQIIALCISFP